MSVRIALTLACVFVIALALPAGAQTALTPGGSGGMMGRGGSGMPGMGGGMMGAGMGGGMGGQTQTYDLAKAKRLMAEAADLIENGKTQYAAGQYREARRLFKNAKEKLDEVRGSNQQGGMGMGGGTGGAPMMGAGGGPMMMGGGSGPMGMSGSGGSGGPMMMGGEGGPMMGGAGGGMGGGFSTGLIPPEKDDLVVQARIMWMTAVAWWGKSWGAIATTELVPDRVLLGPWTSGTSNQMGGMAGGPMGMSGSGGMGGPMPMMSGAGGK